MSLMTAGVGLPGPDFFGAEQAIRSSTQGNAISPRLALHLSLQLVRYAEKFFKEWEDSTPTTTSSEKTPTSPGGCGCQA